MNDPRAPQFAVELFALDSLDDEIRVDLLCRQFLRLFYLDLTDGQGLSAEQAAPLTYGADYFLRDFIIADRRENIFLIDPQRVRQFAGNWYIITNLEPNLAELQTQLQGIAAFYKYCAQVGKVTESFADEIVRHCSALDYYRERIESFWAISGDGFLAWNQACSYKD